MTYSADLVCRSALVDAAAEIGGGKETPPGSNKTTYWAEVYPEANRLGGWAWCAGFLTAIYLRQGVDLRRIFSWPYYCPTIEAEARRKGFWTNTPRPGDLVLYGGAGQPSPHIGIFERWSGGYVQAIEGNTSPGSAGSQDDGGGVYRRLRPTSWVHGFVDMRKLIDHYAQAGTITPVDGLARQREMRDAGTPIDIDGLYGLDSRTKWSTYMSTLDDLAQQVKDIRDRQSATGPTTKRIPIPGGDPISADTALSRLVRAVEALTASSAATAEMLARIEAKVGAGQ